MLTTMKLIRATLILLGFAYYSSAISAISVEYITVDKPEYYINIQYPKGFDNNEVNKAIVEFIQSKQNSFMNELPMDAKTPPDAPGKTALTISYFVSYESKHALSVRFNVSTNHRGAAHPAHKVFVLNFIDGKLINLSDLFQPDSKFLNSIAEVCSKAITAKNISDAHWIEEGTRPSLENYSTWHFTKEGIAIVFNNYQVAAYVYGEQVVDVPLSVISPFLKPDISTLIWGN